VVVAVVVVGQEEEEAIWQHQMPEAKGEATNSLQKLGEEEEHGPLRIISLLLPSMMVVVVEQEECVHFELVVSRVLEQP
jgi:hypothetical protein